MSISFSLRSNVPFFISLPAKSRRGYSETLYKLLKKSNLTLKKSVAGFGKRYISKFDLLLSKCECSPVRTSLVHSYSIT